MTDRSKSFARLLGISRAALCAGLLCSAGAAFAQTSAPVADPQDDATTTAETDIVVTGSRVILDGTKAPTPVTVVSAEQLAKASPGTIGEALIQLPVFQGSTRPSSGSQAGNNPTTGSFLNLRNLGQQRTLILVDGRRVSPSALTGSTDTNTLPQELVSRVDVVTGGASAAYGSDAVSGVVNFVLDTDFTGLKGNIQQGISTYGDDNQFKASLTGGVSFADNKGHVVVSGSYLRTDGVESVFARPWGRRRFGIVTDPTNAARLIIAENVRLTNATFGGVITASPAGTASPVNALRFIQFGPGGVPQPYDPGVISGGIGSVGGQGDTSEQALSAFVEQKTAFGHAKYEVATGVEFFAEAAYADVTNRFPTVRNYSVPQLNPVTIFTGNAFLPTSLQQQLTTGGIPSFTLGRISEDFGKIRSDASNKTVNLAVGGDFDLFKDWKASAYYTYGRNVQYIQTIGGLYYEKFYAAADAVRDPASGQIVCRVTLTNPGAWPGCVPVNLFGVGSPSQAAINYFTGTNFYRTELKRQVVAANASGSLFELPAGPLRIGFGAEYRKDEVVQTSDPDSQRRKTGTGIRGIPAGILNQLGSWIVTNNQPLAGEITIKEFFGEAFVPVLRDSALGSSFDLNAAVRYADYSSSGGVTTWKLGATYEPVPDLRLRITRSRDIRAPNVSELFAGPVQSVATVIDRARANAATSIFQATVGNPALQPERANTLTVGAVFQPTFFRGFALSVDYYNIELKGVIGSITGQQTVDQCAAGSAVACSNIVRAAPVAPATVGAITNITLPQLNLSERVVRGIDIEASYRGSFAGGNLAMRAIASHLLKGSTLVPGGTVVDRAGEVGLSANPRWAGNFSVNYDIGNFTVFAQERFVSAGRYDVTRIDGVTINDNTVDPRFYTDLTLRARVPTDRLKNLEFSFTVNNLFNREPPNTPLLGPAGPNSTNTALYDTVGRFFTVGARFAL